MARLPLIFVLSCVASLYPSSAGRPLGPHAWPSDRGGSRSLLKHAFLSLDATPGAEHESQKVRHEADHQSNKDHIAENHGHSDSHSSGDGHGHTDDGHGHTNADHKVGEELPPHEVHKSGDHAEKEKKAAGLSTSELEDVMGGEEEHGSDHHEDQTHEGSHDHAGSHGQEGSHGHKTNPNISGEGAHSVAVGLVAGAIIIPLVIGMILSEGVLGELTFRLLDTFTSIFLAVLWFNTFSSILKLITSFTKIPFCVEVFSAIQVFVLYVIANVVAFLWRNNHLRMTTFCSIGAHFIAFAGIITGSHLQHETSLTFDEEIQPMVSFAFCFVTVLILLAVSAVNQFVWRKRVEHHAMNHALDHLELDILGLVISFLITQAVRHALREEYPKMHHLLLQRNSPSEHIEYIHPQWQCWFMLGWSVFLTVLAGVCLPMLNQYREKGWVNKLIHVTKVTLVMLVAWGYILYGQWEFYERLFHGDAMFGHMVFAVTATAVGLLLLYIMAEIQGRTSRPQVLETNRITVTGISLVVAWSWEHCFNIALDVIGQDYQVGYGGLVPKCVLAVAIPAVMLPVYFNHVRTHVINLPDEEG
mmetsp:Transcript_29323/g.57394  ORF Transcript_29323/g.57394 Transcript_29323/m.57394 type:complete len:586 (-) Transcript_29323:119-1876(-)